MAAGSTLIAIKLNKHFYSVDKTLPEAFDDTDNHDNCLDYLGEPSHNSFKFELVTDYFVSVLMLSLKVYSLGYDKLPIQVDKHYFYLLGPLITKLFNDSLLLGKQT